MSEEPEKCQEMMSNLQRCGRHVVDGEKCICHSEDPNKDTFDFDAAIQEVMKNKVAEDYDFTGFIFPERDWELPRMFDKPAHFDNAVFLGAVDFMGRNFAYRASFYHSKFKGAAWFSGAVFEKKAGFDWAQFHGEAAFPGAEFEGTAGFSGTKFCGRAVFAHAKFGGEAVFESSRFEKRTVFDHAVFRGVTDFTESDFYDTAKFCGTRFEGRVAFVETVFLDEAQFRGSTFKADGEFLHTDFVGLVDFAGCALMRDARVVFRGKLKQPVFHNEGNFRLMRLWDGSQLRLEHVSLDKCHFLETDITKIQFTDVEWPRRSRLFGLMWRNAVADELSDLRLWLNWLWLKLKNPLRIPPFPTSEYGLVAQLYRDIQAYYISKGDYVCAGDFYFDEQEMNRKDKGWLRRIVCVNWIYRQICFYGESYLLPFWWLVMVLLAFPIYLLFDGLFIGEEINYTWSSSISDILLLKADYWNAVAINLSIATFNRGQIANILIEPYKQALLTLESFALVILASFLVLALRRRFKRKSF